MKNTTNFLRMKNKWGFPMISHKSFMYPIIVICEFLISCMMAIFDEWMVVFRTSNKITLLILEKLKSCCCREVKNESENKFLDKVGPCNHILSISKVSWARVTTQEEKRLMKQLRKDPYCVKDRDLVWSLCQKRYTMVKVNLNKW